MPLYEYECLNCCARFELRRSFDDVSEVACPECHGEVRRLVSPVAVVFKGPGFYATDNGKGREGSRDQQQQERGKGSPVPDGAAKA